MKKPQLNSQMCMSSRNNDSIIPYNCLENNKREVHIVIKSSKILNRNACRMRLEITRIKRNNHVVLCISRSIKT